MFKESDGLVSRESRDLVGARFSEPAWILSDFYF